ncbi:hypothetical protein COB21_01320 [Candidatus Aerophobetes bacterium]|uniref:Glycosyl transferase family 17 n=1 Tax=Aerophobetes bacterium TaxID=2030807 RepID=A0A2A4X6Q2_UNCAE|nr:MAG: hypothetical protein COB21_01320 [Candidatus Aerophobetes bacterium]
MEIRWMLNFFKLAILSLLLVSNTAFAKVYDCFMFFNEYDILDIRFHELYDHVDHFVIVESCEGHAGLPKEFNFEKNKEMYAQFLDKVIYIKLHERQTTGDPWIREHYQRNQIMRGLVNCGPEDVIFISDCDEIMEKEIIQETVEALNQHKVVLFKPRIWSEWCLNRVIDSPNVHGVNHPAYNLFAKDFDRIKKLQENFGQRDLPGIWGAMVAVKYKDLVPVTPQLLRDLRHVKPVTEIQRDYPYFVSCYKVSGWHFSNMGGHRTVRNKMENWAHSYDPGGNPGGGSDSFDHQGWWNAHKSGNSLAPIDEYYPQYVQDNIDYFIQRGLIDPYE